MAKKFCTNHSDRRIFSKGLCIDCYRAMYAKPLKKTALRKISEKMVNILSAYKVLRIKFLRENPICQLNLWGCYKVATEIHHSAKKQTEFDWLNIKKYVAVCRKCHQRIEENPKLAKELNVYNYNVISIDDDRPTTIES